MEVTVELQPQKVQRIMQQKTVLLLLLLFQQQQRFLLLHHLLLLLLLLFLLCLLLARFGRAVLLLQIPIAVYTAVLNENKKKENKERRKC